MSTLNSRIRGFVFLMSRTCYTLQEKVVEIWFFVEIFFGKNVGVYKLDKLYKLYLRFEAA